MGGQRLPYMDSPRAGAGGCSRPLARATLIFAPPRGRISHCVAGQVGLVRRRRSSSRRTVSGGAGATPNRGGVLCSVQQQGGFPSHEEGITLAGRQRRKGTL